MKILFASAVIITASLPCLAQQISEIKLENSPGGQKYSYAYILIEGKPFSKKLKVSVDFGDTPEQMRAGKEYSDKLTNKKSYAAILNHMVESEFELVETLDYADTFQGSGGTSGIVFIMRKKTG
jgi:hypothetical protein